MGRPSWASPEQLKFLRSYQHELPQAKAGTGLNVLYARITQEFMAQWEPEPFSPHTAPTATSEELIEKAKVRLLGVRFTFTYVRSIVDSQRQRVTNWYKELLKSSKKGCSQGPYQRPRPLDLTGRSARKKPPYQPPQAFSILYWRPKDSLLRHQVNDLWAERQSDAVRGSLNPFINADKNIMSLTRLQFHMAVMQWKCSLLSPDELETLHSWIDEQRVLNDCPWAEEAKAYGDGLAAENRHMQWLVIHLLLPRKCR